MSRFESALSSIADAVIVTDEKATITFMNPKAEKLTGRKREEALGKPLGEVFIIVDDQLREPVESPVDRVIRQGAIVGLAGLSTLVARDGILCPIDDRATPIRDHTGKITGVV